MIPLDDPKWKSLNGGYKVPYDASGALLQLEQGELVWDELWQELHHQGDVGEASYAALPHLARIAKDFAQRDWNFYSLVSTIEIERHRKTNPPIPEWLVESYDKGWQDILELALDDLWQTEDPQFTQSILGAVALAKGCLKLGALVSTLDNSELNDEPSPGFPSN